VPRKLSSRAVALSTLTGDLPPAAGVRVVDEAFLQKAAQKPTTEIVDINAPIPVDTLSFTPTEAHSAFDAMPVPPPALSDEEIINRPLRPKPPRPVLRAVELPELDKQWDDFMEWLPRQVRDKIYGSRYTCLSAMLAVPKRELRQQFAANELLFIEDAFVQFGHPLRDAAPAAAARSERFRKMRRG